MHATFTLKSARPYPTGVVELHYVRQLGKVRDLWAHADLGTFTDHFSATVPAHGVVMVRITRS